MNAQNREWLDREWLSDPYGMSGIYFSLICKNDSILVGKRLNST